MRCLSAPLIVSVLLAASLNAQTATKPATRPSVLPDLAGTEVIDLWPNGGMPGPTTRGAEEIQERVDAATGRQDRIVRNVSHPTLTRFAAKGVNGPTAAVIVIPGGGYAGEVFDREGNFIAMNLRDHGVAAFVLKYRLPPSVAPRDGDTPSPIADVQQAVRLLRANAKKYDLEPHRIGVMGFSAGGHVAGSAATQFDDGNPGANDPIAAQSSRPDFAVLMYAVSSMHESIAHAGSRKRLLGENPPRELEDRFSTAQRITRQTPPLFLVHAKDDRVVKYENSVEVAAAAKEANVPCEFVTLETGGHGFGLGVPGTEAAGWMDKFFHWLGGLDR